MYVALRNDKGQKELRRTFSKDPVFTLILHKSLRHQRCFCCFFLCVCSSSDHPQTSKLRICQEWDLFSSREEQKESIVEVDGGQTERRCDALKPNREKLEMTTATIQFFSLSFYIHSGWKIKGIKKNVQIPGMPLLSNICFLIQWSWLQHPSTSTQRSTLRANVGLCSSQGSITIDAEMIDASCHNYRKQKKEWEAISFPRHNQFILAVYIQQ